MKSSICLTLRLVQVADSCKIKFMKSFRHWGLPAGILLLLISLVVTSAMLFHQTEEFFVTSKSEQIAYSLSKNMDTEIFSRIRALKVVGSTHRAPLAPAQFREIAKSLVDEYSGLYAVNYVGADGIIKVVYPEKENKAALGRDLMKSGVVAEYLLASKADRLPRLSHRVMTFQNFYAFVLYVPLYDSRNNFVGWLNAVFDLDHALESYMSDRKLENAHIRLRWHHPAENNVFDLNWIDGVKYFSYDFKVLNQNVTVDVGFSETPSELFRKRMYYQTIFLRGILLLVISYLMITLFRSKFRLTKTNERLQLKNNLLNSLSHDISSPITSLTLALDTLFSHVAVDPHLKNRAEKFLRIISDMIKNAKLLHTVEIGVNEIKLQEVMLKPALLDAIEIVADMAAAKKVTFKLAPELKPELKVLAHPSSLAHNVIVNVLTNCIKFSPASSEVQISVVEGAAQVSLSFLDCGHGVTEAQIAAFRDSASIPSVQGTAGETGTGLGILQISSFMKIYGGSVDIENAKPLGTRLTLKFRKPSVTTV